MDKAAIKAAMFLLNGLNVSPTQLKIIKKLQAIKRLDDLRLSAVDTHLEGNQKDALEPVEDSFIELWARISPDLYSVEEVRRLLATEGLGRYLVKEYDDTGILQVTGNQNSKTIDSRPHMHIWFKAGKFKAARGRRKDMHEYHVDLLIEPKYSRR